MPNGAVAFNPRLEAVARVRAALRTYRSRQREFDFKAKLVDSVIHDRQAKLGLNNTS